MSCEYTNISTALLCYHDSELDPAGSSHSMGVNNTINNCSKIYSSTVNSDLLNRGSVNTIDVVQNIYTLDDLIQNTMPCHMKANAMFQNCHNSDRFSKDRNCTVTWAHDARNQLTCQLGDFESPAGDPVGGLDHELIPWGHKHRVDVFTRTYECEMNNVTLIFVHSSPKDDLWGWYYLAVGAGSNNVLLNCNYIPQGSLQVSHSTDIYLVGIADNLKVSPVSAYQDYLKDYQMQTYTTYMEKIVDALIVAYWSFQLRRAVAF